MTVKPETFPLLSAAKKLVSGTYADAPGIRLASGMPNQLQRHNPENKGSRHLH